jgi:hypothetical protein
VQPIAISLQSAGFAPRVPQKREALFHKCGHPTAHYTIARELRATIQSAACNRF